jgi:CHAD domain-containing protein
MKLQPDQIEKPLVKLRKQLHKFPSSPAPEDVHSLRTQARRLEATMTALALHRDKSSRRLLKLITPVRKAAGKVRDMDVLIGDTLTLSDEQGGDAIVLLVEHLAKMRIRHAQKLHKVVKGRRNDIRKGLKDEIKVMRKKLKSAPPELDDKTAPRLLITELSHWPALDETNLHLFRIRIKELRYMLQLGETADEKFIQALGEVKDAIGEWHDWVELLKIAGKKLDPQAEHPVLPKIEEIGSQKLQTALTVANRMRARYFAVPDGRTASRRILSMAS